MARSRTLGGVSPGIASRSRITSFTLKQARKPPRLLGITKTRRRVRREQSVSAQVAKVRPQAGQSAGDRARGIALTGQPSRVSTQPSRIGPGRVGLLTENFTNIPAIQAEVVLVRPNRMSRTPSLSFQDDGDTRATEPSIGLAPRDDSVEAHAHGLAASSLCRRFADLPSGISHVVAVTCDQSCLNMTTASN